jgi:hypothetical protein
MWKLHSLLRHYFSEVHIVYYFYETLCEALLNAWMAYDFMAYFNQTSLCGVQIEK